MQHNLKYREPDVVTLMSKNGVSVDIDSSIDASCGASCWLKSSFPFFSYGQIDWSQVPNSKSFNWHTDYSASCIVSYLLGSEAVEGSISVLWSDTLLGSFRGNIQDVMPFMWDILVEAADTWIIVEQSQFCVEVYHEGKIGAGYAQVESTV